MSLSLSFVQAVVDNQMGELQVTFTNDTGAAITDVVLSVAYGGTASPEAAGHLDFIPSDVDGGYVVPGPVAAGDVVQRSFAVKPVDAEAGKQYVVEVHATWAGGGGEVLTEELFVEARPEVYAAIGAAEQLRGVLLNAYDNFKATGRTVHQETALPDTRGEPVSYSLQPSTFQWALGVVELGTKLFKDQKKATGNEP